MECYASQFPLIRLAPASLRSPGVVVAAAVVPFFHGASQAMAAYRVPRPSSSFARPLLLGHKNSSIRWAAGEAMIVHQVLPDRFGVAASIQRLFDEFSIGFAGAGGGGLLRRAGSRVGDHLVGRF